MKIPSHKRKNYWNLPEQVGIRSMFMNTYWIFGPGTKYREGDFHEADGSVWCSVCTLEDFQLRNAEFFDPALLVDEGL